MLHYATVLPDTLQLLRDIQAIPQMSGYPLVGGTALALQIGHRLSIDLDFFGNSNLALDTIKAELEKLGPLLVDNRSESILNLRIRNIKVDVARYRYPLIAPTVSNDGLILAGIEDIAAMKLSAVVGRGSKKDFIDIYFLLNSYTLEEMMRLFRRKISDESDLMIARSLTYFVDADKEVMPDMLVPVEWSAVKERIKHAVKDAWF